MEIFFGEGAGGSFEAKDIENVGVTGNRVVAPRFEEVPVRVQYVHRGSCAYLESGFDGRLRRFRRTHRLFKGFDSRDSRLHSEKCVSCLSMCLAFHTFVLLDCPLVEMKTLAGRRCRFASRE